MKRILLSVTLATLFSQAPQVLAQDSATLRGAANLLAPQLAAQTVEATGKGGTTQPRVWRFVVADRLSRSGVSIVEVENGKIKGRDATAYVGGGNLPVYDLTTLKVDSGQAFQIANQEAVRAGLGFDSVDYALRVDVRSGKATWVLTLVDRAGQSLGNVFISPETGRVTRVESLYGRPAGSTPAPPQQAAPRPPAKKDDPFAGTETFFKEAGNNFGKGNYYLEKGARTVGGSLQEFFTGRRTIDRKYWEKIEVE